MRKNVLRVAAATFFPSVAMAAADVPMLLNSQGNLAGTDGTRNGGRLR